MMKVSGRHVRGRPRLGWMNGVNVSFGSRGMTLEAVRQCAKDRAEWRAVVHMQMTEFYEAIFVCLAILAFLEIPFHALVVCNQISYVLFLNELSWKCIDIIDDLIFHVEIIPQYN